jgi:hypothetical protein
MAAANRFASSSAVGMLGVQRSIDDDRQAMVEQQANAGDWTVVAVTLQDLLQTRPARSKTVQTPSFPPPATLLLLPAAVPGDSAFGAG